MSVKNIVQAIPLESFDTANLAVFFKPLYPAGTLPEPLFLVRFFNPSNQDVFISYDGINAHDFVPHGGGILQLNFQTNSQPNNYMALLSKGTVVYVLGAGAGVGFFYMSGYYQPQQS